MAWGAALVCVDMEGTVHPRKSQAIAQFEVLVVLVAQVLLFETGLCLFGAARGAV
jgi:hypothetical protein